jgi:protein ImuB
VRPVEQPLVLVEKQQGALRLTACDRGASRLGLQPGMTLADARARLPELVVRDADRTADDGFLQRLAGLCDRFTPVVALDPPHGLLLDISGCTHLFGGEAALRGRIRDWLVRQGLAVRASVAGTPDTARALARFSDHAIAPPGLDEATVRPLPVAALGVDAETVVALSRAGLKTLGDLADRPSTALAARFGEGLTARLFRVLGRIQGRITPLRPLPDCRAEQQFPEPLLDMGALEAVLADLLTAVIAQLELRGLGGRSFCLSLFRSDGALRRLTVETGRSSRDAAAILRLYRERLETLADPIDPGFGFDLVRLDVPLAEGLEAIQPDLDGRTRESQAVEDLLDRLTTRFGRDRVLCFVAQDSHEPERVARQVPATGRWREAASWPPPVPDEPPTRPLQLFDPPHPIETLAQVPDGPPLRFRWQKTLHEVVRAEGPERIAPEWWHGRPDRPTRDYYRLEDHEGRRFWVFRSGLYERDSVAPRWFLHGRFA